MPNWAGSCWYYLRYLDPANHDAFVDPANEGSGWAATTLPSRFRAGTLDPGGIDLYVGGVEHAVLHLLYARHKVLYDLGHVSSEEHFRSTSRRATSRPTPTPTAAASTHVGR